MIPENNILQSLHLMFYILNLLRRHGIRNSLLFLPFEYSLWLVAHETIYYAFVSCATNQGWV